MNRDLDSNVIYFCAKHALTRAGRNTNTTTSKQTEETSQTFTPVCTQTSALKSTIINKLLQPVPNSLGVESWQAVTSAWFTEIIFA